MASSTLHTIFMAVRGDGTGTSVFAHAATLARRFGAHISVVHCHPKAEDMMPYGVVIPTFDQMKHPERIPESIKAKLPGVGLWDVDPINLFRISWKNDVETGLYGGVNSVEVPRSLTGVKARIASVPFRNYELFPEELSEEERARPTSHR